MLALIVGNCVLMAMKDPLAAQQARADWRPWVEGARARAEWRADLRVSRLVQPAWSQSAELTFTVLFTTECCLKMVAMGLAFESKTTYFRDAWNWLDALTVGVAWLALLPDAGNLSSLRSIRVLRPLRTVQRVKGMRVLVGALLASLPDVLDVLALFAFFLLAFGVVGVELFAGRLHYRCYAAASDDEPGAVCTCGTLAAIEARRGGCDALCEEGELCRYTEANPNGGVAGFDTIFHAMANVFQAITLEGWTDLMYMLQRPQPFMAVAFFLLVVFFGAFFVINLFLVVVSDNYLLTRERTERELEAIAAEEARQKLARRDAQRETGAPPPTQTAGQRLVAGASLAAAWLKRAAHKCLPGIPTLRRLTSHPYFDGLMVGFILMNTVAMAAEFYGTRATTEYMQVLLYLNFAFTAVFLGELLLKLAADGAVCYFAQAFNVFDCIVVFVSVLEVGLYLASASVGLNLSVLRMFRILRAFKLARSFKGLREILFTIRASLMPARDLSLLLVLAMFIFALLGMELFAGTFGACSLTGFGDTYRECVAAGGEWNEVPAENFDSLGAALMSVFIVFVGENWNDVWHTGFENSGWGATAFFLAAFLVGNFMLMNLFVAILCGNYDNDDEQPPLSAAKTPGAEAEAAAAADAAAEKSARALARLKAAAQTAVLASRIGSEVESSTKSLDRPDAMSDVLQSNADVYAGASAEAVLCLRADFPLRLAVLRLVLRREFELVVLLLIAASSICLALDDPSDSPASPKQLVLFYLDILFNVAFTVEMLLKILAFGIFRPQHAYLRSRWNWIDVLALLPAWVSLALVLSGMHSNGLNALRALRALRPLRLVNRVKGMKVVVQAMYKALPGVGNVALVSLLFVLIFSILGVQLFHGTFAQCTMPLDAVAAALSTRAPNAGVLFPPAADTREACEEAGALWFNPDFGNFDNVVNGMILLFELMTAEMWPDLLHLASDAYLPGHRGRKDHSLQAARLYCVTWVLVGCLFIGNLFVGCVLDNFDKLRADERGRGLLSAEQMAWVAAQRRVVETRAVRRPPKPTEQGPRAWVYDVVMAERFERLLTCLIVCNALVLAVTHYEQPPHVGVAVEAANMVFSVIWLAEAALKLHAFGVREYFSYAWNRFDFFLVFCSLSEVLLVAATAGSPVASTPGLVGVASVLRLVRLARLVRVIKNIAALRALLTSLIKSLPSLMSVGSLMFLLLFIYAVLGVQMFHGVALNPDGLLTDDANFRSLPEALLTLFRASTGESWNGVMHDLQCQPHGMDWSAQLLGSPPRLPRCMADGSDCGSFVAVPYFVTFTLLSFFLLLNAVIGVLLEHFSENPEDNPLPPGNFESFAVEWSKLDPHATLCIPATSLPVLLRHVSSPLGLDEEYSARSLFLVLQSLHAGPSRIPLHKNGLYFYEVLMALTRRHCPLPPEGLGRSRFAVLHHNAIRQGLRANNSSATGVLTKARRGSGTDEVVKALGVLDVWAAQQLQARWRCIQVRRQFLLDHRGVDPTAAVKEQILRQRRASSSDLGAAQLGGSSGSNPPSVRGMGVVNQLAAEVRRRSAAAQGLAEQSVYPAAAPPATVSADTFTAATSAPSEAVTPPITGDALAAVPIAAPLIALIAPAATIPGAPRAEVAGADSIELVLPSTRAGAGADDDVEPGIAATGTLLGPASQRLQLTSFDVAAGSGEQLMSTKLPRSLLCSLNPADRPAHVSGRMVGDFGAQSSVGGGDIGGTPTATGVFITDDAADFPFKWVPCQPRAPPSDSPAGYVYVLYTLKSTGGRELTEADVVNNPEFVLRMLRRQAAAQEHREQLAELRAEHRGVFTATRPGLPNSAPSRTTSTGAPSRPTAASTAHARRLETKLKELQVGQARQPPSGWLEGDAHQLSAVEFEAVAVGVIDSAVPADDSRGGARQVPPQVVRRQKPKPSRARR